ncbi:MAG: SOS response-associated peptidase, partial [Candidatus Thorarchaeota archaeon]
MCGRYTLFTLPEVLGNLFLVAEVTTWQPRYNIAPTQQVPVVRLTSEGKREMVTLRWGLIPFWSKEPFTGRQLINARSETVDKKSSFREAFKHRRCLLPADGFYEWKRKPNRKQPYHIRMLDGKPFAFAGLWENWEGSDGTLI